MHNTGNEKLLRIFRTIEADEYGQRSLTRIKHSHSKTRRGKAAGFRFGVLKKTLIMVRDIGFTPHLPLFFLTLPVRRAQSGR